MRFDRFDGLNFVALEEKYGKVIGGADIPGGYGYGYVIGSPQPAFTLSLVMHEACNEEVRRRFIRFRELIDNPNFKGHYIRFPSNEKHNDGFYLASNLNIRKDTDTLLFSIDIHRIGGLNERRVTTKWSENDEDFTGWAALTANSCITLPYAVSDVAWVVTGTNTGDDGTNQYLINPTRSPIMYTMPNAGARWFMAEAKCWDTLDDATLAEKSEWSRVLSPTHTFQGKRVFENGILRYVIDGAIGRFYLYSATNGWQEIGQLKTALTGNLDAPIVRAQVLFISSEEIGWREMRQNGVNPIQLDFSLRRGVPFCRIELTCFSLGIGTGTYVQLYRAGGFLQMFNSAVNGAAGGGNLNQDATNNYECAYNATLDYVSGFVLCDQPTKQPYDCGAAGHYLAESNIWAVGQKRVFFVAAWNQETNPFVLATGRANALAIARQCMANVEQSLELTSEYYV